LTNWRVFSKLGADIKIWTRGKGKKALLSEFSSPLSDLCSRRVKHHREKRKEDDEGVEPHPSLFRHGTRHTSGVYAEAGSFYKHNWKVRHL
jgi:hypothetical protein